MVVIVEVLKSYLNLFLVVRMEKSEFRLLFSLLPVYRVSFNPAVAAPESSR